MVNRETILILGDSNCVPRIEDNIYYKDIFPSMLVNHFNVINRSRRGNDTFIQTEDLNISDDIKGFNHIDYCIINLGLVDYAPRLFKRKEQKILSYLPSFISSYIIKKFSKNRMKITKLRNINYVNIIEFERNYQKIIDSIGKVKKIILIKIIHPSEKLIKKSYDIEDKVKLYNNMIEKLAFKNNLLLIDPNNFDCHDIFLDDGIHFKNNIHTLLYKNILELINEN